MSVKNLLCLMALGASWAQAQSRTSNIPETVVKSLAFDQSFDAKPLFPLVLAPKSKPVIVPAPTVVTLGTFLEKQAALGTADAPARAPLQAPVVEVVKAEELAVLTEPPTVLEGPLVSAPTGLVRRKISLKAEQATVTVLDEESFNNGETAVIPGATVHWIHEQSGLRTETNEQGWARPPFAQALSLRFFVKAPGYLPATGYAVAGLNVPVMLIREERLAPVIKSLNVSLDHEKVILWGRALDENIKAIARFSLDLFLNPALKAFYSIREIGLFGPFHPTPQETGPRGDFLVAGLHPSVQYLLPNHALPDQETLEWPAHIMDLEGTGPLATTTLLEPRATSINTEILDFHAWKRPDSGIIVTLSGQSHPASPDEHGTLKMERLPFRNNVDILEVKAIGYRDLWVTAPSSKATIPGILLLTNESQLQRIFNPVLHSVDLEKGLIMGSLRPEIFKNRVSIEVRDSFWQPVPEAKVHYLVSVEGGGFQEPTMIVNPDLKATLADIQSFAISDLADGEYHIVVRSFGASEEAQALAVQVSRTKGGPVTQMQF